MIQHAAKLVALVILLTSCKPQNDNVQLSELVKRLHNSNILLRNFNDQTLSALEDVLQEINPSGEDLQCVNNGKKVNELSTALLTYLENVKENPSPEVSRQLYHKLIQYKQDLVKLVGPRHFPGTSYYEENKKRLFKNLPVLDFINDSTALSTASANAEKWVEENFGNSDTMITKTSLLKIENDVLGSEQILLKHLKDCTAELICGNFDQFAAIVVLNSSYVQSGDVIEVIAGIGQFTAASKPTIFIDGKNVSLNPDAHATYSVRAIGKPGKYSIPVELEFFKPDGTKVKLTKNLNYTITK